MTQLRGFSASLVHLGDSDEPAPPEDYFALPEDELSDRITECRERLGERVLILAHHYQGEDIVCHSDYRGDSYALAQQAASLESDATIVFAGVHFMAETADVLTPASQAVILPDPRAGCTMADMATAPAVEVALAALIEAGGDDVVPITYVNSTAAIKAVVARAGGATCTSSNAERMFRWAFEQGRRVLFVPDEHLGRNVAFDLGIPLDDMALWRRDLRHGGLTPEQLKDAPVVLWDGYCSVHQGFAVEHVEHWRAERPDIRVVVHPECAFEVVRAADASGSTHRIIELVSGAEPGTAFAIGTEINLVNRLRLNHPDRFVASLSPFQCLCATMYRIRPPYLLWILEELLEGRVRQRITVDAEVAADSRLALERMLEHGAAR